MADRVYPLSEFKHNSRRRASAEARDREAAPVSGGCWRRASMLGIGLLSGGYGTEELKRAGAYRVCEDPAMLLAELGVRDE